MTRTDLVIRQASLEDIEQVTTLLLQYLNFYNENAERDKTQSFIRERFENKESIMFLAFNHDEPANPIGLAHLYPMFSTLSQGKIWILNDLFINEQFRGLGVGKALIDATVKFAESDGAFRVDLKTEHNNRPARKLYEKYGFNPDKTNIYYSFKTGIKTGL